MVGKTDGTMMAQLTAQAEQRGADLATLRALIEESTQIGANRAMAELGLADAGACSDISELRELLSAWRDAKKSARKAAIGWIVRVGLALLLIGLAVKLGLANLVMQ